MSEAAKRKKPNYYMQKKRKHFVLEPGIRGFICTCNFREKECISEAYNILNLYADQLKSTTESTAETKSTESDSDQDIADELSKEITEYKNEKPSQKRFQVVESGAKNLIFIRTTITNPVEMVSAIINDILTTKQQKTRFILRLLPIELTCKANMEDIKQNATILIKKYFFDEPKTFAIMFNHRNTNIKNREEIVKELHEIVISVNKLCKVDLKNAELTIIVEVIRGICLMSVVPDYSKYKKYNLSQIYETVAKQSETEDAEKTENTVEDIDKNNCDQKLTENKTEILSDNAEKVENTGEDTGQKDDE